MTRFTVNNQPVEYRMDPQTPLLWALRDASNLTGTKYGCGNGQCGACTVDVDGEAVLSCQATIGSIEGSFVTTIEGLSRERDHPAAARVDRGKCAAMRVLYARHVDERGGAVEEESQPVRGRYPRARDQSVPLWCLSPDRGCRACGCACAAGRRDDFGRGAPLASIPPTPRVSCPRFTPVRR